ncbi:MFS transporter, partial [Bacteroides sp.]
MSLSTSNLNSKLLTASFIKVCSANFLLFFALYMVLPITPFEVESSLEGYSSWYIYLLFVVGLLIGGPFHNYLIENFNRKKICSLAYLGVISPALLFLFTTNTLLLFLGVLVQGVCFGLATAASITIAIDVTSPRKRGKGNIIYAWAGRSGMVLAVPISIYLQLSYGYEMTVYVSMASGILALLLTRLTHHPFRAPNEVSKLSLDRFILPQGWRLILMMVALAFIPGSMFPHFMENLQIKSFYIVSDSWVFILLPFVVFILSAILSRLEIDALLHNKGIGFLLSRVPIILIAIYVFSNFY